MDNKRDPAGLILSAGLSSRMKEFKPLMEINGRAAVSIVIDSMRLAGIRDIFVVLGHNADEMRAYLKDQNVKTVYNENFEQGMFTSIQKGIAAIKEHGNDCILMTPVDIPLIPPYIYKAVMNRYYNAENKTFTVACYGGKKGHPLLIPAALEQEILDSNGEHGLKSVTSLYEDTMIRVDTHCKGILMDMDTQEAYRELLEYYENVKYPDREQCEKLLAIAGTPEHIIKHCMSVMDTAVTIGRELNKNGYDLSIPLIQAAGMLHDSQRIKEKHWDAGADFALEYGYPEVAAIIREHMSFVHELPVKDVTEKDLICLSDKLRQEDRLVTLDERLDPVRRRWKHDPESLKIIEYKLGAAGAMIKFIESRIGRSVYDMLRERDAELAGEKASRGISRRVMFIRHGETQRHNEKIFLGQTDVPLSNEGRDQCNLVGLHMQNFRIDVDRIYCSDLKRAVESAEIIASLMAGRPEIVPCPEFREMSLGSWDGMYIRDVRERYPEAYEARGRDMIRYRIDENAENFLDVMERGTRKLNSIIEQTEGDIVIVAHSGVIRAVKCAILDCDPEEILNMKIQRGAYEFLEIGREYIERFGLNIK